MEASFWHNRWQQNQITFHQSDYNHLLVRYQERLPKVGTILVPLCGKSRDMTFLAQRGSFVVGAELVESALTAFYEEQGIPYKKIVANDFTRFDGGGVRTYAGDFFALSSGLVGPVSAVYDRAALIALPESMRQRYLEHLFSFLPPSGVVLLISIYYEGQNVSGPPFSVSPQEVEERTQELGTFAFLEEHDILMLRPDLQLKGYTRYREWAGILTKRST
jgi:thiopurine S-methyltransferase